MSAPFCEAIFPSVIDNTIRQDWVDCPHRCFRRHFQGLRPKGALNLHLHFGGCFAHGLKITRRLFCNGTGAASAILAGAEAILRQWGDAWPTEEVEDLPGSAARKTLPACLDAHFSYFVHYPLEGDALEILRSPDGEPMVEVSFCWPIPGTSHPQTGDPILYAGRFDCVGQIGKTIWNNDEKTAGQLGERWQEQWALDAQQTGYVWGLRQYDIPVTGAIIRGVGILSRDITFSPPVFLTIPPWRVEQWLAQLRDDIADMRFMWERYIMFLGEEQLDPERGFRRSLNKSACHQFNKPCTFLPLCTSPDPERWLDDYVVDRWDPLKSEEEV
jgi:hypothetical protein